MLYGEPIALVGRIILSLITSWQAFLRHVDLAAYCTPSGRQIGMPEYEYEALDASGKSFTGTISCRDEQQALEALDKSGLHPTKLTLREETPPTPAARPIVRIVAGLLGILFFWVFYVARNDPKYDFSIVHYSMAFIFLAYAILGNKLGGMWTKRPY